MSLDYRMDVLRDALISGMDDAAMELIRQIAETPVLPTPWNRSVPAARQLLQTTCSSISAATSAPIRLEIETPVDRLIEVAERLVGRPLDWSATGRPPTVMLGRGVAIVGVRGFSHHYDDHFMDADRHVLDFPYPRLDRSR